MPKLPSAKEEEFMFRKRNQILRRTLASIAVALMLFSGMSCATTKS